MSQQLIDPVREAEVGSGTPGPRSSHALLDVLPAPARVNRAKLARIASRHRVLIVRSGAVVAVSTLIAIGGALFLHGLFAGLLWLGYFWMARLPVDHFAGGPGDDGGSPGLIIAGSNIAGGDSSPAAAQMLSADAMAATPVSPALPALPESNPLSVAAVAASPDILPSMGPTDLGSVKVTGRGKGTGSVDTGGAGAGTGTARGGGGTGTGAGTGAGKDFMLGNGLDRGYSAADRDPQLLSDDPSTSKIKFVLPDKYISSPPDKDIELILTILPNGKIGDIRVAQSCGVPELDELYADYVRRTKRFSPGYKAGKAVTKEFPLGFMFHPDN